ncbi:carbohydrate esterase family 1 protein [Podospora appendiculata]|uniref:feruloyl esterase n=1 Tax=Podospora appendiculata TaxID=314037 RepID=A0AAE0XFI8_9PEZI|nr:carbohydrate esterase family 1 protein [Podospora appendiculata]
MSAVLRTVLWSLFIASSLLGGVSQQQQQQQTDAKCTRRTMSCTGKTPVAVNRVTDHFIGKRTYKLFIPPTYSHSVPAPVILSFHGRTKTADHQLALDQLTSPIFNNDSIVVYPNGLNNTWEGVPLVTTDDRGFTAAILDALEHDHCVDTARVFATGKSQGGGFVGQLACDPVLSRRITAFAPVAGAFYIDHNNLTHRTTNSNLAFADDDDGKQKKLSRCAPEEMETPCAPGRRKIPIIAFQGGADQIIPYGGGPRRRGCLPAIPHWVRGWAARNGLDARRNVSRGLGAGSEAVVYEFGEGSERGLVTHVYCGDRVGHSWPSTRANADSDKNGDGAAGFNASAVMVAFFARWSLC